MNKQEFFIIIQKMEVAYNKKFGKDELTLWFSKFNKIPKEEFEKAVDDLIRENKFIPKISEVETKIIQNSNRKYTDDPYRHLYKNNEWGEFVS